MAGKLKWRPEGPLSIFTGPSGPAVVLHWIRERLQGQESADPVIRQGRFCAVRRQDDRGTRWLHEHWLELHRDDPDLWFLALLFRACINHGGVAGEISLPLPWNAERYLAEMRARKAEGKPTEHHGHHAYTIYAYRGYATKFEGHVDALLNPAWQAREQFRPRVQDTCETFYTRLRMLPGVGTFIAGQVVADCKFFAPLCNAPDVQTFAISGPGSRRGLARVRGKSLKFYENNEAAWQRDFNELFKQLTPEIEQILGSPLSASDFQSALCETDKLERYRSDRGELQAYVPYGGALPKKEKAQPPPATGDLQKAAAAQTLPHVPAPMPESTWQAPTELPDLCRAGIIAIDTETKDDGLRTDRGSAWPWHGGQVAGISVAYRADGAIRAHYIPLRHPETANFDPVQVFGWLRDLVASDVRFVTQNGLYDWGWLRADSDIRMPPADRLEELGALATLVDENRFAYSLDALCAWRDSCGHAVREVRSPLGEGCQP